MSFQSQNRLAKPVFVFEHKMIKEEIETLKHIYFDNMEVFPFYIFALIL